MAGYDPVTSVINAVTTVIDKVFPDATTANEAKAKLLELQTNGELKILGDQAEINKIEAASESFYKAGWRPSVAWICVVGFLYSIILQPILQWICVGFFQCAAPPIPQSEVLFTTLGGLLGLGSLRSWDKKNGI